MAKPRIVLPRAVTVLLCTLLQICFGTVYAWSFFQTLLVPAVRLVVYGHRHCLHISSFSRWDYRRPGPACCCLRPDPEDWPRPQRDVFCGLLHRRIGPVSGQPCIVLPRLRRDRRRRDRARLCHSSGNDSQVVSGPQGAGDWHCRHGLRHRSISAQQGAGTCSYALYHRGRSATPIHLARHHIRLHPDSVQSFCFPTRRRIRAPVREAVPELASLRKQTQSGAACSRPDLLSFGLSFSSTSRQGSP